MFKLLPTLEEELNKLNDPNKKYNLISSLSWLGSSELGEELDVNRPILNFDRNEISFKSLRGFTYNRSWVNKGNLLAFAFNPDGAINFGLSYVRGRY